jgi:hypothetical protein
MLPEGKRDLAATDTGFGSDKADTFFGTAV